LSKVTGENTTGTADDEARARAHVGRRRDDHRSVAALQVGERRAVEQDLVVEVRRQLGATPARGHQRSPVRRGGDAPEQFPLDVALQEAPFVLVEQLVAVQPVGQRGEAAAGNAGDDTHFVESADLPPPGRVDLDLAQRLEHAVRERGGARAAA
jgi:hypothetical protein